MKNSLVISLVAAALALTGACSSRDSADRSGRPFASCTENPRGGVDARAAAGDACSKCVQSDCNREMDSIESGCVDYFTCACSGQRSDPSCEQKATETSCQVAEAAYDECVEVTCSTPCKTFVDGG